MSEKLAVDPEIRGALLRYRVLASVVGVLLVVLVLVGVPLANFDGTGMWGSSQHAGHLVGRLVGPRARRGITEYLGSPTAGSS